MPKLFAGQFGAEITTLLGSGAEVIHSSLWGGDLEGLVLQGAPRGLFEKHKVILSAGEPAINRLGDAAFPTAQSSARADRSDRSRPTPSSRAGCKTAYADRYQVPPNYASFKMAQAILGVKAAYEKAKGGGSDEPDQDKIIAAFENLDLRGPGRHREDGARQGPSGRMDAAVGTTKVQSGQLTIVDVVRYPAEKVNPPDGMKSEAWIKSGLKK